MIHPIQVISPAEPADAQALIASISQLRCELSHAALPQASGISTGGCDATLGAGAKKPGAPTRDGGSAVSARRVSPTCLQMQVGLMDDIESLAAGICAHGKGMDKEVFQAGHPCHRGLHRHAGAGGQPGDEPRSLEPDGPRHRDQADSTGRSCVRGEVGWRQPARIRPSRPTPGSRSRS